MTLFCTRYSPDQTSRPASSAEEKGKGKRPFILLGQEGPGRPGSSVTCYNCGQLGHIERNYSRSRGHDKYGGRGNEQGCDQFQLGYQQPQRGQQYPPQRSQ